MNNVTFTIGGTDNVQADGSVKQEHVGETAEFISPTFDTANARALTVDVIMRVVGTGSITVNIERYDKASKTWILMLAGVAIITNVSARYTIGPDVATAANVSLQSHLPEMYRVRVSHGNANAVTYSLSGGLHN